MARSRRIAGRPPGAPGPLRRTDDGCGRAEAPQGILKCTVGVTIERHNRFRKIAAHHQDKFEKLVSPLPQIM
jgi:hypothetical protein